MDVTASAWLESVQKTTGKHGAEVLDNIKEAKVDLAVRISSV